MSDGNFQRFEYLHFAIEEMSGAEHELCMSGVPGAMLPSDDAVDDDPLAAWQARLGARYGVATANMLPALGTSGGVFLTVTAVATLLRDERPGRPRIAIETPAYGVFETAARLAGADIVPIPRPAAAGYRIDLDAVRNACREGAALVCVTNLHNPSGVALTDDELDALRTIATDYSARVLIDEVYRDFLPGPVATAFEPGGPLVTTSSMTKCYGWGPARAGWIFGDEELIDRATAVREIAHGVDPEPAIRAAARGLANADAFRKAGQRLEHRSRPVMDAWVTAEPRVSWTPPEGGITGLLEVEGLTDSMAVARQLRADLGVQVVAGAYFGAEGTLRVSFGLPPARLHRALETLGLGIGALVR